MPNYAVSCFLLNAVALARPNDALMTAQRAFALALLLLTLPQLLTAEQQSGQPSSVYVYWNSSTFSRYNSVNKYVIQANMNDQLVVYCPYSTVSPEFYYIYYTTQASVVSRCNLTADPNAFLFIQCTNQPAAVPYTFSLTPFNPLYGQLVFQPGKTYYLVSTSTMQSSGMANSVGGACSTIGASLTLQMACCPPDYNSMDSQSSAVPSTTATTCCPSALPIVSAHSNSQSLYTTLSHLTTVSLISLLSQSLFVAR